MMTRITVVSLLLLLSCHAHAQPELLTVAERSGWRSTATHEEVLELIERLRRRTRIMRVLELGRSVEDRALPLIVLANPPVESAEQAAASGKLVVFAFGNIHAGEVCGKEALLILARELAATPNDPLFRNVIVVLAPIYNADGNERMSPDNRPGQVGPVEGMGERANAQGLDLNRDYVKLESSESRALVRFLTEWNPDVTIDTHTTNGTRHRYALTYAAPLNPSGHAASIEFLRDELLPTVSQRLRSRTGYDTFFYGNLDEERTAWRTYSALPRFGGPYRGLRGQMSILSEAYAYAPYQDRVLATLEFVREILLYAAEHHERIRALARRAHDETIEAGRNPQPDDVVGIRHRIAALPEYTTIRTTRETGGVELPQDITVVHMGRFEPTRSVRRPAGYLIAAGQDAVVEKLRQHGIRTLPFRGEATVETYTISSVERAEQPFQGHHLVRLEADAAVEDRPFDAGTVWVPLDQPLGTLAVYLLEPESEDGLAVWNFFDAAVAEGAEFPVYRVRTAADLRSEPP